MADLELGEVVRGVKVEIKDPLDDIEEGEVTENRNYSVKTESNKDVEKNEHVKKENVLANKTLNSKVKQENKNRDGATVRNH